MLQYTYSCSSSYSYYSTYRYVDGGYLTIELENPSLSNNFDFNFYIKNIGECTVRAIRAIDGHSRESEEGMRTLQISGVQKLSAHAFEYTGQTVVS